MSADLHDRRTCGSDKVVRKVVIAGHTRCSHSVTTVSTKAHNGSLSVTGLNCLDISGQ